MWIAEGEEENGRKSVEIGDVAADHLPDLLRDKMWRHRWRRSEKRNEGVGVGGYAERRIGRWQNGK